MSKYRAILFDVKREFVAARRGEHLERGHVVACDRRMSSETPFATLKLKGSQCFGLDAHPSKRLHAAGLISGQLKLFSYEPPSEDPSGGNAQQVWSARPHTSACRAVRFAADGETIYSTGADGTLQERDIEKNKPVWRRRNAMPAPINAMALLGEKGVATGDDEGHVRCWDMRQRSVTKCASTSTRSTSPTSSLRISAISTRSP